MEVALLRRLGRGRGHGGDEVAGLHFGPRLHPGGDAAQHRAPALKVDDEHAAPVGVLPGLPHRARGRGEHGLAAGRRQVAAAVEAEILGVGVEIEAVGPDDGGLARDQAAQVYLRLLPQGLSVLGLRLGFGLRFGPAQTRLRVVLGQGRGEGLRILRRVSRSRHICRGLRLRGGFLRAAEAALQPVSGDEPGREQHRRKKEGQQGDAAPVGELASAKQGAFRVCPSFHRYLRKMMLCPCFTRIEPNLYLGPCLPSAAKDDIII